MWSPAAWVPTPALSLAHSKVLPMGVSVSFIYKVGIKIGLTHWAFVRVEFSAHIKYYNNTIQRWLHMSTHHKLTDCADIFAISKMVWLLMGNIFLFTKLYTATPHPQYILNTMSGGLCWLTSWVITVCCCCLLQFPGDTEWTLGAVWQMKLHNIQRHPSLWAEATKTTIKGSGQRKGEWPWWK